MPPATLVAGEDEGVANHLVLGGDNAERDGRQPQRAAIAFLALLGGDRPNPVGPLQIRHLLPSLAGQQQQPDDGAERPGGLCRAPNRPDLVVGQGDLDGLPLAFHLTGGEASDSRNFELLLDIGPDILPRAAITDKGYDAKSNRDGARKRGICPVIPHRATATDRPAFFPKILYKARARIEQAVGKLKRFKRIALRCEKTARNYGSFVALALQGNRVKDLCGDEACEEVVVPCGGFSPEAEGIFAGGFSDQVVGHVFEGCEVGGRVIGADAAFVVAEHHVHHPVQAVLDRPMTSDDGAELACQPCQRSDVEAGLLLDLVGDFARALDHDDALQSGPIVALLEPVDVMDRGVGSGLDAAVIAIDGLMAADLCVLEALAFCSAAKSATSSRRVP